MCLTVIAGAVRVETQGTGRIAVLKELEAEAAQEPALRGAIAQREALRYRTGS